MCTLGPSTRIAAIFLSIVLLCRAIGAQDAGRFSVGALEHLANLDFKSLETQDDLPHQSVYGVAQDSTGYMWIATYGGLSRFDGYRLRTYRHDRSHPGSLPDNTVRVLVPAANGDLWIGTDSRGVWFYRAATDSFEALPNAPPELLKTRVYTAIPDLHGGIWAGGAFGLFHFDPRTGFQIFPATHAGAAAGALPLRKVFALHLDPDGVLWVGGDGGLVRKEANGGFEPVRGLEGPNEVGATPPVWSFLRDSANRLWVGCDHVGLALYDPVAHVLRGIPGLSGANSAGSAHTVREILEHRPGQLWIATYGGGLITYDIAGGFIRSFTREGGSLHPLQNSFLRGIVKDRSGVVWLATDNGVATVNDSTTGVFQLQPKWSGGNSSGNGEVRSVAMIGGAVWVGFDHGGFGPLGADGTVHPLSPAPGAPPTAPMQREVLTMQQVDDNTAFVAGTGGGLFRIDLKNRTYRRIPDPKFDTEVVTGICPDGDRFWAARSDGLLEYNWRTGEGQLLSHDGSPGSLSSNDVRSVLRAKDGRLWISTSDGLNLLDGATGKFRAFRHSDQDPASLPANDIRAMIQDHAGRLWVATSDAGLGVLTGWNSTGEPTFQTLDRRNGLTSETVYTLTLGKDGTVWANTGGGLAAIQPDSFAVRILTAGDGLRVAAQKLFASVTMEDGTLLFRGPEGLILVKPELLGRPSLQLPIVMTGLFLAGESGGRSVDLPPTGGSVIRLDPRHRGFQAEFALLDFASPANTQYSYRLEGYDKDWKPIDAGARSVIFSNLPPGRFTLHIRASSRSGEGPTSEASFRVEAPREWSETALFRIGLILIVCGAGTFVLHLRTASMRRRSVGLEHQVSMRTSELEDNKRQLQAANLLLQDLATRDSLTELSNRRHFLELAEREVLRFSRMGRAFSVLLLDIDRFKEINDTHGHLIGDVVIRSVGARILSELRTTDLLARFGGEEYVVLLPETESIGAGQVAERIRVAIQEDRLIVDAAVLNVTVSIGCAEFQEKESLESVLDRADRALYRAKSIGRNRVESA